ncbi:hypothetical protein [Aliikangiella sp. IMCC44632]
MPHSDAIFSYQGACGCGNLSYQLALTQPLKNYLARYCDCDFCQQHQLAYLSDPAGSCRLYISNPVNRIKQGSEQAEFIQCENCKIIIAVTVKFNDDLIGAVNVNALVDNAESLQKVNVSPKQLNASTKLARWQQAWMKFIVLQ